MRNQVRENSKSRNAALHSRGCHGGGLLTSKMVTIAVEIRVSEEGEAGVSETCCAVRLIIASL